MTPIVWASLGQSDRKWSISSHEEQVALVTFWNQRDAPWSVLLHHIIGFLSVSSIEVKSIKFILRTPQKIVAYFRLLDNEFKLTWLQITVRSGPALVVCCCFSTRSQFHFELGFMFYLSYYEQSRVTS